MRKDGNEHRAEDNCCEWFRCRGEAGWTAPRRSRSPIGAPFGRSEVGECHRNRLWRCVAHRCSFCSWARHDYRATQFFIGKARVPYAPPIIVKVRGRIKEGVGIRLGSDARNEKVNLI